MKYSPSIRITIFEHCGIIPKKNKDVVLRSIGHFDRDFKKKARIKWGIALKGNESKIIGYPLYHLGVRRVGDGGAMGGDLAAQASRETTQSAIFHPALVPRFGLVVPRCGSVDCRIRYTWRASHSTVHGLTGINYLPGFHGYGCNHKITTSFYSFFSDIRWKCKYGKSWYSPPLTISR